MHKPKGSDKEHVPIPIDEFKDSLRDLLRPPNAKGQGGHPDYKPPKELPGGEVQKGWE